MLMLGCLCMAGTRVEIKVAGMRELPGMARVGRLANSNSFSSIHALVAPVTATLIGCL